MNYYGMSCIPDDWPLWSYIYFWVNFDIPTKIKDPHNEYLECDTHIHTEHTHVYTE